ncbi:D-2-hydroxyacid dehydrogenase [Peribacillus kribbensis]|uniref:D-2-hydroxyacid dehydrogenase n=1 Tax=Peribacillus kribbensis TaxID=356658 RepID=UPI00040C9623|nr:D-2-hydroxyacid dehydrogenase [Peribacillus kribbensis]
MSVRKLIIAQNLEHTYVERIRAVIPEWEVIVGRDREVWLDHISEAEVIAGWKKVMADHIGSGRLKWVQTWSAGIDTLPLNILKNHNVALTNATGVHAFPISETIFALMLGLTRKLHSYVRNQQAKTWYHSDLKLEIHNKTIGILGIGAIGQETAKIAKAFGMEVLGLRHSGKQDKYVDRMYKTEELNDMLPLCDYVVVTLPLTKETHHLIGKEQFKRMKDTAFFINIGRGILVVEDDLMSALQSGEIAGAGLDVFETEPLPESSALWELENVIVTPHTAGSTQHYDERVVNDIFIPNLKIYLNGDHPAINLVDYKKGY